jgi:hypothetical protein
MVMVKGQTNGYDGFGTSFHVTLPVGVEQIFRTADGGTDIGATNKTLDLTGTATDTAEVELTIA